MRVQAVAVRAAIPEEFQNFDLTAIFGRLRLCQNGIVLTFDDVGVGRGQID